MSHIVVETKLEDWKLFAALLDQHIIGYVVPQYGDFPDEMIENMSPQDIKFQLERYAARIGKGSRGAKEELRDCFKIAHYASYLYGKLCETIQADEPE